MPKKVRAANGWRQTTSTRPSERRKQKRKRSAGSKQAPGTASEGLWVKRPIRLCGRERRGRFSATVRLRETTQPRRRHLKLRPARRQTQSKMGLGSRSRYPIERLVKAHEAMSEQTDTERP